MIFTHPDVHAEHPVALDYQTIATAQDLDAELKQKSATQPQTYARIAMRNDVNVIVCIQNESGGQCPVSWTCP
jgi:hypothetical protein